MKYRKVLVYRPKFTPARLVGLFLIKSKNRNMKQAVTKLIAKYTEMFNELSLSKETGYLGVRVMIVDTMVVLNSEGIITHSELMEAMSEINIQIPHE